MSAWRVTFEDGTALVALAESADAARLRAQFMAWSVSGQWWQVATVKEEA